MKTKGSTIARTIVLAIVIINAVLKVLGISPIEIDESQVYEALTAVSVIVVPIWTWWKNNSFTVEAKKADEILHIMREEGLPAVEELMQLTGVGSVK